MYFIVLVRRINLLIRGKRIENSKGEKIMKTKIINRRNLLKSTAAAGIGLTILPSGILSGANAPSNKLNVAMIGTWGRADAHFGAIS